VHRALKFSTALLLLAALVARAQVPGVTITGTPQHAEPPLPKLRSDEFSTCMSRVGMDADISDPTTFMIQATMCDHQLAWEKHTVIEACLNRDGKTAAPRAVQACTESLDQHILEGDNRFFLLASRAHAYVASGDWQHALDDYSAAIKLSPHNASLYYNRGIVLLARSDDDAALRDFDTAIGLDPKSVRALVERARIDAGRNDLGGALGDYSQAIRLQPGSAPLWSERGYLSLLGHDYRGAVKDESQAVQLDPNLARGYYLRAVAFSYLRDGANAVSNLRAAVGLDASLAAYVTIKDKVVTLGLPPL